MTAINFGNGPNTSSGDTVKQALEKLQARIDALQGAIPPADTTPDAFTFTDATNVAPGSTQTSDWRQITGINAPAPVSVTGGQWQSADDSSGTNASALSTANGTIAPNKWARVQHAASGSNSTAVNTTLTIGGVSDTFTSTTVAASGSVPALTTLNAAINAQDFAFESTSAYPPKLLFSDGFDETVTVNDWLRIVASNNRDLSSPLFTLDYQLNAANIAGSDPVAVAPGLAAIASPAQTYFGVYIIRPDGTYSVTTLKKHGDTVAPLFAIPASGSFADGSPVSLAWTSDEFVTVSFTGTDGAAFESVPPAGTSGTIRLVGNANGNNAAKASYSFNVVSTDDAGLADTDAVVVNITPPAGAATIEKTTGTNKGQYIDIDASGLTFIGNADVGEPSGARSITALPTKAHYEVTANLVGATFFGSVGAATALGPSGIYIRPGLNAAGFSIQIDPGGTTVWANLGEVAYLIGGANQVGDLFSIDYDYSTPTAPVLTIKRKRGSTVTPLITGLTLTAGIPASPTPWVAAGNTAASGTVNLGGSAFAITPLSGHTGL